MTCIDLFDEESEIDELIDATETVLALAEQKLALFFDS